MEKCMKQGVQSARGKYGLGNGYNIYLYIESLRIFIEHNGSLFTENNIMGSVRQLISRNSVKNSSQGKECEKIRKNINNPE